MIEALARLDVVLANEGTTSTFRRNGRESIIDITFYSSVLIGRINWNNRYLSKRGHAQVDINTMERWQAEWDASEKGRWTYKLIPNISTWVNRRHGEVNFILTQFLSGHGCFREYLHRFGNAESPLCPTCGQAVETVEHVVFICPRFQSTRREMMAQTGANVAKIVQLICKDERTRAIVDKTVAGISIYHKISSNHV